MNAPAVAGAAKTQRTHRADIQALRAIAVTLVIADHAEILQRLPGHPTGGFIGVDVFFVISGFLITGHLLRERFDTGSLSFIRFYIRRARRILPMAVLVVVVVVIASFLVFWPSQAERYALDGVWSLLFVSNIAFSVSSTDYFANADPSIFQHYWSLSVEEQFYVMWPILIVVATAVAAKAARRNSAVLTIIIGLATVSFVWACIETTLAPTVAYFSTFSRGFEFAMGATVAAAAPALARTPRRLRLPLAAIGLAVLAVSVWVITPPIGFPGPWALLPVSATALVIAAGAGLEGGVRIPLVTSRPVDYVGNISYSLYLWHWPLIVFAASFIESNATATILAVIATFLLSALSYRFVEQSVLKSSWLLPERRNHPHRRNVRRTWRSVLVMTIGFGLVTTSIAVGSVVTRATASDTAASYESLPSPPEVTRLIEALQPAIEEGLSRDSWTNLRPPVDDADAWIGAQYPDCWTERLDPFRTCTVGDPEAKRAIVLFGDSIAMSYVPAFISQLTALDANLHVFSKAGCPPEDVQVADLDGSPYESCDEFRAEAIRQINALHPDLVVISTGILVRTTDGATGSALWDRYADGWRTMLSELTPGGGVAVLTAPPSAPEVSRCANRLNTPVACQSTISGDWVHSREVIGFALGNNGTMIDSSRWFCTADGRCPATIDDMIVRRDSHHLTPEFSGASGPILGGWLDDLLGR